jgi:hypothetical protein
MSTVQSRDLPSLLAALPISVATALPVRLGEQGLSVARRRWPSCARAQPGSETSRLVAKDATLHASHPGPRLRKQRWPRNKDHLEKLMLCFQRYAPEVYWYGRRRAGGVLRRNNLEAHALLLENGLTSRSSVLSGAESNLWGKRNNTSRQLFSQLPCQRSGSGM